MSGRSEEQRGSGGPYYLLMKLDHLLPSWESIVVLDREDTKRAVCFYTVLVVYPSSTLLLISGYINVFEPTAAQELYQCTSDTTAVVSWRLQRWRPVLDSEVPVLDPF